MVKSMKEVTRNVEKDMEKFRIEDRVVWVILWVAALGLCIKGFALISQMALLPDPNGADMKEGLMLMANSGLCFGIAALLIYPLMSAYEEDREILFRRTRMVLNVIGLVVELAVMVILYLGKSLVWSAKATWRQCCDFASERIDGFIKKEKRRKEVVELIEAEEYMEYFFEEDYE